MRNVIKKHIIVLLVENGGDLIQFVQNYFNIDFLNAMEKLNVDFNLKIPEANKIDKKELERIKKDRKKARIKQLEEKRNQTNKLLAICKMQNTLKTVYKELKAKINAYNWEETEYICGILLEQIEMLEDEFNLLNVKI